MLRHLGHGMASLSLTVGLGGPPAPTDPPGTAVMEVLEEDPEPAPPSTAAPRPRTPPPPPVPAPTGRPQPAGEVVVAPGDSFWSLAEAHVAPGARPSALTAYWRRFVEANRSRLVDPANPDLLYAGQVLTLPPADA
jgi:nucleoid-associated protein YgaU